MEFAIGMGLVRPGVRVAALTLSVSRRLGVLVLFG